jgi:hypothetical protein
MDHRESPAAGARVRIAHLQRGVQAWIDEDRILPADGSAPLAALERALEGLRGENPSAARAGVVAFIRRVEALIHDGAIEAVDARLPIETARALLAALRG